MSRIISPEEGFSIERAVTYLVIQYQKSGHNKKPVVLHSVRVGLHLLELGYETDIVIVGILHDILEDTSVSLIELHDHFGLDIARWVAAVSFNPVIADPTAQYMEMFERTMAAGRPAVVVKAADLHSNSLYYRFVPNICEQAELIEKVGYFLKITPTFSSEPVMACLNTSYQRELTRVRA